MHAPVPDGCPIDDPVAQRLYHRNLALFHGLVQEAFHGQALLLDPPSQPGNFRGSARFLQELGHEEDAAQGAAEIMDQFSPGLAQLGGPPRRMGGFMAP
jgi:hypothetical protein